jgi:hypothetical protein
MINPNNESIVNKEIEVESKSRKNLNIINLDDKKDRDYNSSINDHKNTAY